mmetsp:Transcript_8622/g.14581  ORF Transcript_8622/g.14581 Transcript_8622/m.14581 type:complete len:122 (-) Transcript_8622:1280-1645(-)
MLTGGGADYTVRVWDFNTMNALLKPYKYFVPFDGHPVRSLGFSFDSNASYFLCCCGNNQARVYDRQTLNKLKTTVRGDMYISDMANTKGHVASITGGQFHPKDSDIFITSSQDGSVRQWDY